MRPEVIPDPLAATPEAQLVPAHADAIHVERAVKLYPGAAQPALDGVDLSIREGEFFTLLGPSGCGKTTLLRLIAGFEDLTQGRIALHGQDIGSLPPNRRLVNTVFQSYALFPHMTVRENVAYGLLRLRRPRKEAHAQVDRMLDLVKLQDLADRRPHQLSGGQQQRVALARALAPEPKVLLLDEPLSALDLKLRQEMRTELKALQERTGLTFLFVTHDQEEALAMSDRIAVMSRGRIEQLGTGPEIYHRPTTRFVATFIGETNLLPARVLARRPGGALVELAPGLTVEASGEPPEAGEAIVSIRPEALRLRRDPRGPARVERTVFLGTDLAVHLRWGLLALVARVPGREARDLEPEPGLAVVVEVDAGTPRLVGA